MQFEDMPQDVQERFRASGLDEHNQKLVKDNLARMARVLDTEVAGTCEIMADEYGIPPEVAFFLAATCFDQLNNKLQALLREVLNK